MTPFGIIGKLIVFFINVTGLTLIINFSLANVKKSLKWLFTILILLMFVWVDLAFGARLVSSQDTALTFLRIAWSITPMLFVIILLFVVDLLELKDKYSAIQRISLIVGAIFFFVTLFTNAIIKDISYRDHILAIVYGKYVWTFFIAVIVLTVINFMILYYRYTRTSDCMEKDYTKYLLVGLSIFFIFNAIFNIVLPFFFKIVHLYEFGDYSTIVFVAIIAYAVMKNKFFGVKVFITTFLLTFIGSFLLLDSIMVSRTFSERILSFVIFVSFIPVGIALLTSMIKEIEQKERLNKLARQQKDIIDIMGHEIRTPLTVITQETNLYKFMKDPPSQMLMSSIKNISKAVEHAIRITNTMLETARIDKKRFTLNISKFDVVELLKDSVNMNKKLIKDGDIEFKNKIKADHLEICADKTRIREAVDTIINNAIKYRDPKKDVLKIKVYLKREGNHIQIGIKDNGIGINPEDIPKLGRKFVRLDSYTKSGLNRPGGTGLGLYVVKSIVKAHKGELIIKSSGLHKGSEFILVIPIGCDR